MSEQSYQNKYNDWVELIKTRAKIELALYEAIEMRFTSEQRARVNNLLLEKNPEWVKYVYSTLLEMIQKGVEDKRSL